MKEAVVQFKTDWVERRIVPHLKKVPFISSDMETVLTKIDRKNTEGQKEFKENWANITPSNLVNFVPIQERSKNVDSSISKLKDFEKTWVPTKKPEHAAAS